MSERFDVVIVGAGSAGCVLAARLSEDDHRRVLLVEQGPTQAQRDELMVQRAAGQALRPYYIGRGLGGSSAVNAMLASPPEQHSLIPLACAEPNELGPLDRALIAAAGAAPALLTRDRQRVTAADAYLTPAAVRPNLARRPDVEIHCIALDGPGAVGVETITGEFIAANETIVCAGAIGSPVLLLRSGVRRHAIGRGLRDHPTAMVVFELREPANRAGLVAATMWREDDLQVIPLNHLDDGPFGALVAGLMTSRSEGSIELADGEPVVRFDLLADERDRARLRAATRWMVQLAQTEPFHHVGYPVDLPDLDDDAALDAWLLARTGDYYHASCSCRTGAGDDPTAVVDTNGRVHGYDGLRVCDASTLATLPSVNTHMPVVLQAERVAAAIRAGNSAASST